MNTTPRSAATFSVFALLVQLGCGSGKELLLEIPEKLGTVKRIAIIGFPGQCTYKHQDIPFLAMAVERFGRLKRFHVISPESTFTMASLLGVPAIYANDEYSTLDVQGVADLGMELNVDAVLVGFYRNRIVDEEPKTYINESGQTVVTTSYTYAQNFPTFEVCIVASDASLLFRAVSEGRKTGFWNVFWDSVFKSESDDTFHDRIQDALDDICEMLED